MSPFGSRRSWVVEGEGRAELMRMNGVLGIWAKHGEHRFAGLIVGCMGWSLNVWRVVDDGG